MQNWWLVMSCVKPLTFASYRAAYRRASSSVTSFFWSSRTSPSASRCKVKISHGKMARKFPEVQPGGSLILAWQIKDKKVLVVGGGEVRHP